MNATHTKPTQANLILERLESGLCITQMDAWEEFSCSRLAPRIHELIRAGHDIQREIRKNEKTGARFAAYFIPAAVAANPVQEGQEGQGGQ